MTENKFNFDALVSIVKVEPEQFQAIDEPQSADDILRAKANISSRFLERIDIEQLKRCSVKNEKKTAKTLAMKGNEGLCFKDPHTCCLCQETYSNRNVLWDHLEKVHLKTKEFNCNVCGTKFFTKTAIKSHLRIHGAQKFACELCRFKTTTKSTLKTHQLSHNSRECPICHKRVAQLEPHMKAHDPKVPCTICNKLYAKSSLRKHLETHSKNCNVCEEKFIGTEELRRHKLRKHFNGRLFECHCGAVYKRKEVLDDHKQKHEGVEATCDICQKKFSSFLTLKCHQRTKHGTADEKMKVLSVEGLFICDHCGSEHSNRRTFLAHYSKNHRIIRSYCDLCPRSFGRKRDLVEHIEKDHLKLRRFKCEQCDYGSYSKHHLSSHSLIHGLKTECKICNQLVTNLAWHLKTHIEAECPICKKKYNKGNLANHIRTVH